MPRSRKHSLSACAIRSCWCGSATSSPSTYASTSSRPASPPTASCSSHSSSKFSSDCAMPSWRVRPSSAVTGHRRLHAGGTGNDPTRFLRPPVRPRVRPHRGCPAAARSHRGAEPYRIIPDRVGRPAGPPDDCLASRGALPAASVLWGITVGTDTREGTTVALDDADHRALQDLERQLEKDSPRLARTLRAERPGHSLQALPVLGGILALLSAF